MDKNIPFHVFEPENDLGKMRLRYEPLEIRNSYDFSVAHRHAYFEIFFFRTGGGTHLIDFIEHKIADNSVHIVRPGQVHLLRRALGSHGGVLHFSGDAAFLVGKVASGLLQELNSVSDFDDATFLTISALLSMLEAELDAPTPSEEVQMAYLSLILTKAGQAASAIVRSQNGNAGFAAFCTLADLHYKEGRLPAWYAARMFITEKKLNELCKTVTGNTVTHYLKERILLEAKRLLSHSEGSVKEIGYYLGFEDPAYFARFFRKNTGLTSLAFREKYKQ